MHKLGDLQKEGGRVMLRIKYALRKQRIIVRNSDENLSRMQHNQDRS